LCRLKPCWLSSTAHPGIKVQTKKSETSLPGQAPPPRRRPSFATQFVALGSYSVRLCAEGSSVRRACAAPLEWLFRRSCRPYHTRLLHRGIYPLQPLLCNSPGFTLSGICQNIYLYDNGLVGQNRRAADDSIDVIGFILHADFANWLCELRAATTLFIISSNLVRMPGIGR